MTEEATKLDYTRPLKRPSAKWVAIGVTLAVASLILAIGGPLAVPILDQSQHLKLQSNAFVALQVGTLVVSALFAIVALAGIRRWGADAVLTPVLVAIAFIAFWVGMILVGLKYGGIP